MLSLPSFHQNKCYYCVSKVSIHKFVHRPATLLHPLYSQVLRLPDIQEHVQTMLLHVLNHLKVPL